MGEEPNESKRHGSNRKGSTQRKFLCPSDASQGWIVSAGAVPCEFVESVEESSRLTAARGTLLTIWQGPAGPGLLSSAQVLSLLLGHSLDRIADLEVGAGNRRTHGRDGVHIGQANHTHRRGQATDHLTG